VERLDRGAARLRRLLLPRRVSVPVGGAPQHHQPRGHPEPDELDARGQRAQGVLRAHRALVHFHAVRRRGQQSCAQKLQGHGGAGLRLQIEIDSSFGAAGPVPFKLLL